MFVQALRSAGLLQDFTVSSNYTVFAPRDAAIFTFVRRLDINLGTLYEMEDLEYILLSHFINGTTVRLLGFLGLPPSSFLGLPPPPPPPH